MNAIHHIDFHGDTVLATAPDPDTGEVLVPLKPICDRLSVDWNGQYQRLKRDEVLAEGMCVIHIPSPGGDQPTVALPLGLVPGFLFGISSERVADPEARELVNAYKRECHTVLHEHFFGGHRANDLLAGRSLYEVNTLLRMVDVAIRLGGKTAGIAVWQGAGLQGLPGARRPDGRETKASQGLHIVQQFLDDCTVDDPQGRVQASTLYEAYQAWARRNDAPAMTAAGFGRTLGALELGKSSERLIWYTGIRLRHESERHG